jgi:hypothetical protein
MNSQADKRKRAGVALTVYVCPLILKRTLSCVGKIVFTDNWIQEIMYWAVKWVHLIRNRAQICATPTAVVKVRVS